MKQARIVIDARMVTAQGHGIANYLLDLLSGLKKIQEKTKLPYELFFLASPELPAHHKLRHYPLEIVDVPFLHPSELWRLPKILEQLKAELYFTPSFSSLLRYPCPHLQTVHDLNHLYFGSLSQKLYYRFVLRASALSASSLFTVSEAAKKEIQAWLGEKKEIEITLNAIHAPESVSELQERETLKKFSVEKEKFFFCLSNPKPHKNLDFLKAAYRQYAAKSVKPWPLLLSVEGANEGGIRSLGSLNGKELSVLLRTNGGFFFPSLYEGFGRPPLEAAVCERIVVTAKIPSLQEALSPIPEKEKTLLNPKQESEWIFAFHQAEKRQLSPVSGGTKELLLAKYSDEKSALLLDSAIRKAIAKTEREFPQSNIS